MIWVMDSLTETTVRVVLTMLPIIGVFVLTGMLWREWVDYIRARGFAKQKYCVLEIKIPRDMERTPAAMEMVMTALHQTGGESTWFAKYWEGKTRPWFSLEICSINGVVHFYIWTREAWKAHVERSIYAQYPMMEISRVDDYTHGYQYDPGRMTAWGCYFKLTKPDAYPIKTYVDYGLDKPDIDEAHKVDPIANLVEFMGSMQYGEQLWIQMIIRGHKEKPDPWEESAKKAVDDIIKSRKDSGYQLTKDDQDSISAIRRSVSKPGFDVGIRSIYFADADKFQGVNVSAFTGIFKQFNSSTLNGFAPTGGMTAFDYPWQDFGKRNSEKFKKELFELYKQRSFFYPPHAGHGDIKDATKDILKEALPFMKSVFKGDTSGTMFILNTEELATIYHFPGNVAGTPSFERVQSKKSEAPANLPI
jgi:hypothetical protein